MAAIQTIIRYILLICPICLIQGQETLSTFEAASVKRSDSHSPRGTRGGPGTSDPGRYSFSSATLLDLVALSYHVEYFQILSSKPLDRDRFEVIATMPPGTTITEFRKMFQQLLSERFDLRVHLETRDFPAYELRRSTTGIKFKEANDGAFVPGEKPGISSNYSVIADRQIVHVIGRQVSIAALLQTLRSSVDLPIVDDTGLTGKYSFVLDFGKDLPNTDDAARLSDPPSLFVALQQQLGLKIASKKAPFDVVVIDHVNRYPIEN